jgi:soluble lytic murein transglycosylase
VLEAYRQVREGAPGTFYAALASARLAELGEAAPALFPEPPQDVPGQAPAQVALASLLASAGLYVDAAAEFKHGLSRVPPAEALSCGHALRQLGEFGSAYALAVRHLWSSAYGKKDPRALALLYPRAFREAVESSATSHGVDPFLVWAIMRRESAFKPEVVSAADARGLMQIIPPTASRIATELRRTLDSADALFAPGMNIDFGAWYLSALSKRFGHPALVAAAYNAGPAATVKWLGERGEVELDLFVETIPFKETRGYVKQVVADLLLYQQFYSSQPALLPLTLPAPRPDGVAF